MKTVKQLTSKCDSIVNNFTKAQTQTQDYISDCFELANNCGNYSPLNLLITTLPNSAKKKTLTEYIIKYSPLSWDKEKNQFKKAKRSKGDYMIEEIKVETWYDFNKESKVSTLDLDKLYTKTPSQIIAEYYSREDKKIQRAIENEQPTKGDKDALKIRRNATKRQTPEPRLAIAS